MNGMMKKLIAGAVAASALVVASAPADAQRWRGGGGGWNRGHPGGWGGYRGYRGYRGGYYRGGRTGVAIGAGLLGLGLGAAIAANNRPYYGGYDGYYDGPAYGGGYGYYGGRGYVEDCYTRRVWDPYLGRTVRIQTCD